MGWIRQCKFCEKRMRATLLKGHVQSEHWVEWARIEQHLEKLEKYRLPPRFLRRILTLCFVLALSPLAWSQATDITVSIDRARLIWTWSQGGGGEVEKWLIRCGNQSTVYTILVELPAPTAREIPIRQVTPEVGTYFCVIAGTNRYGTGQSSAEIRYEAGKAPGPVSLLELRAQ